MATPLRHRLADRLTQVSTPAERIVCLLGEVIDMVAYMIERHPEAVERHVQRGWAILHYLPGQGA